MKKLITPCLSFLLLIAVSALGNQARATNIDPSGITVEAPQIVLTGIPFTLKLKADESVDRSKDLTFYGVKISSDEPLSFGDESELEITDVIATRSGRIRIGVQTETNIGGVAHARSLPGFFSILPPLLAIVLALILRQVILSLFAGIWLGAMFLCNFNPFQGFFMVVAHYLRESLGDTDHAAVLIFTLTLGGMTAIIYRNGGTHGIVNWLSKRATHAKNSQIYTWLLGLVIFFDDYANTLIVGNTMRPLTDKLKVSREKLAFIVDATSAPVASIALISTWIGTEVGLIGDAISKLPIQGDAYSYFLASLPYRFYPIFMLFMVFYVAYSGRDMFTMLKAERRARHEGKLTSEHAEIPFDATQEIIHPKENTPLRPINAILPILTVIFVVLIGLVITGMKSVDALPEGFIDKARVIIGNSDSYKGLLWASLAGTFVAIVLTVGQKIATLAEVMETFVTGLKSMMLACLILVFAWAIGAVTRDVQTSAYLTSILTGVLSPVFLPVSVFVTAALMSFATGTSWGTMAIMMPLIVPLSYSLATTAGLSPDHLHLIMVGSISGVLAGSVFGDHCSPISDTTVMSSIASGCDHIDHVKTQLPYALMIGVISMLIGDLPSAYGLSPWISLVVGIGCIIFIVRFFGRRSEDSV